MSYIINDEAIFIHIPKTAGNSIITAIANQYSTEHISNNRTINVNYHSTIKDAEEHVSDVSKYYKFTVVRNPYSRATSWFFFRKNILRLAIKGLTGSSKKQNKVVPNLYALTKEYNLMNLSFSKWLDFYINQPWDYTWFSLAHPQVFWLEGYNFDRIFQYEKLYEVQDLKYLQGLELIKTNSSYNGNIDYRNLFNTDSKKLIDKYYKDDIERFNYTF